MPAGLKVVASIDDIEVQATEQRNITWPISVPSDHPAVASSRSASEPFCAMARASAANCVTTKLIHEDSVAVEIKITLAADASSVRKWKWANLLTAFKRIFPPPVVAALLGMFVALCHPIRAKFVDIDDRDGDALLEFLFNGLQKVGQAAVPINMIILGNSLAKGAKRSNFSIPMVRIAVIVSIAKMFVMPLIGLGMTLLMQRWNVISGPAGAAFYLVAMTLSATPTANNIMVMAELAGENKESLAFCILVQYIFAPIVLTCWLFVFVSVATA